MRLLTSILSDLRRFLPPYALSTVWLVTILTICWLPQSAIVEPTWFNIPNLDKIVHFILFFVWAIFLYCDIKQKKITIILLLGIFTACLTELLQPLIALRACDWQDGAADISGLLAGLIIMKNTV